MTTVFVIGFLVGAALMLYRIVSADTGNGWPRHVITWLLAIVGVVFSGFVSAILFSVVAEPVIGFVHRVDALERRCPPDSRPR